MIKYESLMSPIHIRNLVAHMRSTKSTAEDLSDYLNLDESHPQEGVIARDPLDCLLAIIQSDILNMFRLMDMELSAIGKYILNDKIMQQRLVHWRKLLEQFNTQLNGLDASLQGFRAFLNGFYYGSQDVSTIKARIMQCATKIAHLQQRTERTKKSLMANMSIIESKRGIAQAESVTKLTELAFFFIPLTFSASIFSMQLKELSKREVSLWTFFVVAIAITTSSYALRLIIRSKLVSRARQNLFKRIRANSELQPSDPIPTTVFLAWFWGCLGFKTRSILAFAIVGAIPLSLIWTSPIVDGIKVGITVLITIILVIPLVWRIPKPRFFKARFLKTRMRRRIRTLARNAAAG